MSDQSSMQEPTEAPTPKRRNEAREEGQVPRSQELTTAFLLLTAALAIKALGPGVGKMLTVTMTTALLLAGSGSFGGEAMATTVQGFGWKALASLASVLLVFTFSATLIAGVQARGILSMKPLQPKWERLSPLKNGKQMLGWQPIAELAKSLLKLLIVGIAVYFSLRAAWAGSMALPQQSPAELLSLVQTYAVRLLMTAGLAYLGLAAADYAYQIWQHEKKLKMTKQQVKDEHKQNEGDPMVKQRMRSMGRALARKQMMADVPLADVIITNPTHIAVALRYSPEKHDAPVVLAMGQRKIAQRIKQIAGEAGVPMVENKPLARALLASAQIGTPIPAELYVAVAEVLAWVFNQRNRRPSPAGGS